MSKSVDNKKDILLLLIYSPGRTENINEPVIGRTRLTKMLFLFQKECLKHFKKGLKITEENFYEFFSWNFGPFSKQVYDDIMFFVLRGYIEENVSEDEVLPEASAEWEEWMKMSSAETDHDGISEYEEQSFKLSKKGLEFTKEMHDGLSPEQKATLKTFKSRINGSPLKAILKYVYETYPDFASRSKILEKVVGH